MKVHDLLQTLLCHKVVRVEQCVEVTVAFDGARLVAIRVWVVDEDAHLGEVLLCVAVCSDCLELSLAALDLCGAGQNLKHVVYFVVVAALEVLNES